MAQIFRQATEGAVQRVSSKQEANTRVFVAQDGISSTITTVHTAPTAPQGCRDLITFVEFYAANDGVTTPCYAYLYVKGRDTGDVYKIAQGRMLVPFETFRPIKPSCPLPLEPGDELQIAAVGGVNPASLTVYIGGIEYRPAT